MGKAGTVELTPKRYTAAVSRTCALFLFASGAAALVFQMLWIKQLSLVVGIDVYAITTAVSAFFAGMALGSEWFGRWADQTERPLLLYGLLELGIGLCGIGTTIALAHAADLFVMLQEHAGVMAWAVPFLLIGIPAVLMGGTLPVLIRTQAPQTEEVVSTGGVLYAANTAGAIAGALVTAFVLIRVMGVRGTGFTAASINFTLAGAAAAIARSLVRPAATRRDHANRMSPEARLALLLYAIAGAIALGYEVVWSQVVVQFTSTRTFSFAVVLATYLAGLTIGSALYARWGRHVRSRWGFFGFLIAAAGLIALLEIAVLGNWLMLLQSRAEQIVRASTGTELLAMCARFVVAALGIVFVPTVFLGAAFPAALRLIAGANWVGRDVGAVVALNTAGGVAGTILTGFLLMPRVGLVHTLGVLAIAAAAVGFFAVIRGPAVERRTCWLLLAIAAGAVFIAAFTPEDRVIRLLPNARSGGKLVFFDEDPGGTVAVTEQRASNASFRRLYIDGVSNSGDAMPSLRYMRMQALLPLIVHRGESHSALVVGFGTGITTGALLEFPGLKQRVSAELLKGVIRAAPLFHGNFRAAADPRIEIRLRDGRHELLRSAETYDFITLEPPPPSAAGVVNLYSSDFYRLARRRLKPHGIFAQWWPLATQNDEDSRSLVRSFLDVFPYCSLWTTEIHEMLLVGSPQPIELDVPRIVARFGEPGVTAAFQEVGINSAAALLATWITGRGGLESYARTAPPVTDDRPRIEYAKWLRRGEFARVLPRVLALQADPPLNGADEPFRRALAEERGHLLDFYAAALYAYRGNREGWAQAVKRVLSEDPENRYYGWFLGLESEP
jgi:predicted membrane-bound spermidine synthase